MKKLFTILAMICMVAMSTPVMADDEVYGRVYNEDSYQMQGGVDVYIENGAFSAGSIAGSADVVLIQASGQYQYNDGNMYLDVPTGEYVYGYEYDYDYSNSSYNDYYQNQLQYENSAPAIATVNGQHQEWNSNIRLTTGYGGTLEMNQHGYQSAGSMTAEVGTAENNRDIVGLDFSGFNGDNINGIQD